MKTRRNSGMGLMEVMIAMGISTVLALGIMELIAYTTKAGKSAAVATDWTSAKSSIFQALTTMSTCDPMMVHLGAAFNVSVSSNANYDFAHAVDVPELSYPMGPSGSFSVAKENTSTNGLVISTMKLWAISPPTQVTDISTTYTYNQYSVRLQVNAQRDAVLNGGGQQMNFQPYTVDFKVMTGPFGPSGDPVSGTPDTLKGCVP
ncbi:MAG: prepilin-type N-terminal cleavage/methylation domain-containing protein, partial [Deltaproteobacteria bacterium]|nr:prepilin-type N-terminal cleavage/methylation domain-containing protein [Deltaproteobacteria bacterium]